MTARLVPVAFLGGLLAVAAPGGNAQTPPTKSEPPRPARPVPSSKLYPLRHADPDATAKLIERHFGPAGAVSAAGQGVLVTSTSQADEIARLIEQLDRAPRQVAVVVTLAEVASKEQLMDLAGTPDQLLAKLDELARAGQATLKRVTLTGAEGQPVTTTAGGNRPMVSGRAGPAGGKGNFGQPGSFQSVNYVPVATTVKMTARVRADDGVTVDLSVKDSAVKSADEEGPSAIETIDLTTRVTVPPGKAVLAQAVQAKDKAARTTVVVVTATPNRAGK
jgi:hypothetical protein